MSEDINTDVSDAGGGEQGGDAQPRGDLGGNESGDYSQEGWYDKVLGDDGNPSIDKAMSQVSNLQKMVGKKTVGLPDWESEQSREDYYSKVRPEEYKFDEGLSENDAKGYSDVAKNIGLSQHQAQSMSKFHQDMITKEFESATSEEGFKSEMTKRFGEDNKDIVTNNEKTLNAMFDADDKELYNRLPNNVVGLIHKVAKSNVDIKAEYGVNDGSKALNKDGNAQLADMNALYDELNKVSGRGDFQAEESIKLRIRKAQGL